MAILITGVGSGLGKYLHGMLGGIGIDRTTPGARLAAFQHQQFDAIIHCAFNTGREVSSRSLHGYLEDTIFLTQSLLKIPHGKFIFISSIDVYPKTGLGSEDDSISLSALQSFYGVMKLACEALIAAKSGNCVFLRCATLLGPYLRKNSVLRILQDEAPVLTVTSASSFNCILASDLLEFIVHSIRVDLTGVYNVASSRNISVAELASLTGKTVRYGNYSYSAGLIDTRKIKGCFPLFDKTSEDVAIRFAGVDFFSNRLSANPLNRDASKEERR